MKHIHIADMHPLFAISLGNLAEKAFPDAEIKYIKRGTPLFKAFGNNDQDILVLDSFWNNEMVSPDIICKLLQCYDTLKILLICTSFHRGYINQFFENGLLGYAERDVSEAEFINAIQAISQHKFYIQVKLLSIILPHPRVQDLNRKKSIKPLTTREKQIATFIMAGETQHMICKKLKLCPSTVSTHKTRIYKKMQVTNLIDFFHKARNFDFGPSS